MAQRKDIAEMWKSISTTALTIVGSGLLIVGGITYGQYRTHEKMEGHPVMKERARVILEKLDENVKDHAAIKAAQAADHTSMEEMKRDIAIIKSTVERIEINGGGHGP